MECVFAPTTEPDARGRRVVRCEHCGRTLASASPVSLISAQCRADAPRFFAAAEITADRQAEITAAVESSGQHVGDWIAALTKSLGIPTCGGCEKRKEWLNSAHAAIESGLAKLLGG
jgi:hypothetical protein